MQTSLDTNLRAHWQALHSDYVMAHQDYLDLKLQRDAAQGQVINPNALLNARQHLETAHLALHEFCERYARA